MAELLQSQQLTLTTSSTSVSSFGTGTRSFFGTTGLPQIGDAYYDAITSNTYPNIIANQVTSVPAEDSTGEKIYTVTYDRVNRNISYNYGIVNELDSQTFEGGVNALSIESVKGATEPGAWLEAPASHTIGSSIAGLAKMAGRMTVAIITGTTTKTFVKSEAQKNAFINDYLGKAGKINSSVYLNFDKGNLLLGTINGNNRLTETGEVEWVFTVNYHWRIIPGFSQYGWQYVWSADSGTWTAPVLSDGSVSVRKLYTEADISLS